MALEIEKKFRLTPEQRKLVLERLPELGARLKGSVFEENTLYTGNALDLNKSVLRLRRIGERAILTLKERLKTVADIKHQREDETEIADPKALGLILQGLGFLPHVIYEKRRMTWELSEVEVVIDELPFGLYMEIEGSAAGIQHVEQELQIRDLQIEELTYPQLTLRLGERLGDRVEARFKES